MISSRKRRNRARLLLLGLASIAVTFGTLHARQVEIDDGPVQPIVGCEKAFPKLRFRLPLYIGAAPGSTDFYVVEQDGRIQRIAHDPERTKKTTFLDVSNLVMRKHSEEGLLGLAFHPNYEENGHFFVRYSSRDQDRTEVLSRFTRGSDGLADPDSELVILKLTQPWRNHNGGGIEFGTDGYLYIGFGDGGAAGDPEKAGQDLSTWLGTILRIDVNHSTEVKPYAIPDDNPFVGVEAALPEIWAFGFRHPWRFSFDRVTGQLWCGDVGQNSWEEIDVVVRGGNYGWNTYEAHVEFPKVPMGKNESRQLETRVIQKDKDGWAAASYVWNEAQTEAILRPEGATIRAADRSWTVPSRDECSVCHTTVTNFLLAADRTVQLNRDTQLLDLAGLFSNGPEEVDTLGRLFALDDETEGFDVRARSYLDSNCAGCHQPGGPGNAAIDLRFETAAGAGGLLEAPTQGYFGIANAKIVAVHDPDRSVLLHRLRIRDAHGAMPPIASDTVDTTAVEIVRQWIANISTIEEF